MTVRTAARNTPCPCGSGKKVKRCCAIADHERDRRARLEVEASHRRAAELELRPHTRPATRRDRREPGSHPHRRSQPRADRRSRMGVGSHR